MNWMLLTAVIILLALFVRGLLTAKKQVNPFNPVGSEQMRTFIEWFTAKDGLISTLSEDDKMVFSKSLATRLEDDKNFVDNAAGAYLALAYCQSVDWDRIVYCSREIYKKLQEQCYDKMHKFIGDPEARLKLTICDSFVYILRKKGHML